MGYTIVIDIQEVVIPMKVLQRVEKALAVLRQPTVRDLREMLSSLACTKEELAPYVTEPAQLPYGRHVIGRTEEAEVIVIHIPTRTETRIHDHGCSAGCALVIEGTLRNTIYRKEGRGEAVYASSEAILREGQLMDAPFGQIHQMANPASGRTVSLHVYAPPLSGTKTYRAAEEYVLDYVI
jgi:cysteine dioxygenase